MPTEIIYNSSRSHAASLCSQPRAGLGILQLEAGRGGGLPAQPCALRHSSTGAAAAAAGAAAHADLTKRGPLPPAGGQPECNRAARQVGGAWCWRCCAIAHLHAGRKCQLTGDSTALQAPTCLGPACSSLHHSLPHRSIWDVCVAGRGGRKAGPCWEDRRQPLCPGLAGRGAPDAHNAPDIPEQDLPHDEQGRLLRPGVVWFNEALDPHVLQAAEVATASCDLFITAGTSAVVYPAAGGRACVCVAGVCCGQEGQRTSQQSDASSTCFRCASLTADSSWHAHVPTAS